MQPLAFLYYDKLLPGTQLVNRLQDLGYRVQVVPNLALMKSLAEQLTPLLVLADVEVEPGRVLEALNELRNHPPTAHLPLVAFSPDGSAASQLAAENKSLTIVTTDTAVVSHLPQILERALRVD